MEKQKTAVDWLVERLNKEGFAQVVTDEEIQQSKYMEAQQILSAWYDGYDKHAFNQPKNGIEYYLTTYGNHENKAENND